jgi:hypothetical protein
VNMWPSLFVARDIKVALDIRAFVRPRFAKLYTLHNFGFKPGYKISLQLRPDSKAAFHFRSYLYLCFALIRKSSCFSSDDQ